MAGEAVLEASFAVCFTKVIVSAGDVIRPVLRICYVGSSQVIRVQSQVASVIDTKKIVSATG